jgi:hypothetical protein
MYLNIIPFIMATADLRIKQFPWYETLDGKPTPEAKKAKKILIPEFNFGGNLVHLSQNLPKAMILARQTTLRCAGPLKMLMWSKRSLFNLFGQGEIEEGIRLHLKLIGRTCIQTMMVNGEPIELYFNPENVAVFLKAFE